ncbi:MAG: tyrosine-type recombinase/integrase [Terriglobales bacterium]
MARRRFQRGTVLLSGSRNPAWIGRYREDVIEPDGRVRRICRKVVLGYKTEIPTKRLALRELETKLGDINSYNYQPTRAATFKQFAALWRKDVLPEHRPSTQSSVDSVLRNWLEPFFGSYPLREIHTQLVQSFIRQCNRNARTVKNQILILKMVWKSAKAWGYVTHNPFDCLILPRRMPPATGTFTLDEMKQIIAAAPEPFKTMFWLAAETGMRTGEIRALEKSDLVPGSLRVRKSVWHGHVTGTKNGKERVFPISPALEARLRIARGPAGSLLLFPNHQGNTWNAATLTRILHRIQDTLKIKRAGMHAFRHGNLSLMDGLSVPMKVRQERVGHAAGSQLTLNTYTHANSADHQLAVQKIGELLCPPTIQ